MSLQSFTPTSELDAVNALLAAAGEAPIDSLAAAVGRPDVDLARATLNRTHAEVLAERWTFNLDPDTGAATFVPFADVPLLVQTFILYKAGRRHCASVQAEPRWTAADEAEARTHAVREYRAKAVGNVFLNNLGVRPFRGGRR
jgi:hypothetical protein